MSNPQPIQEKFLTKEKRLEFAKGNLANLKKRKNEAIADFDSQIADLEAYVEKCLEELKNNK